MLWLKTDNISEGMPIIHGQSGSKVTYRLWFWPSWDHIVFVGSHWFESNRISTGKLSWRHVSITSNGSSFYQLYLNGTPWTSVTGKKNNVPVKQFQVGFYKALPYFFQGSMACIVYYERVITAAEIKAIMNTCP